jgi:putative membrane-bound dehydrogenase-like protein
MHGMIFLRAQLYLAAITTTIAADPLSFPATPPTEAREAAKAFHVLDGFEMQLIAAEPLVTDPVAITYDENGRAYVCEMNDYPYTDKSKHKPSQENPTDLNIGKVRLLTDTDGDGIFDKASVFAEGLSWPTGAACWKGGIFVTATPDVWYLKDTNDDGVADVKQKVFTGFKKLNVQAVMNNPIWGLDHRIYVAGGSNGGEIQCVPGSESVMPLPKDFKPLPIKRHDFSFDPSTGEVRLESGGARFGNTFDDWGNRFLCNIRNPCQHVVLPYRYLERNPYLVIPSALNDCAEAGDQLPVYRTSPPEPWREFRARRWVQEGSHLPKSELVGAGVVTSSAGITVYRGDAYPKAYRDFAFVADVAGNLFYRMKLVPDGVTFKAVQVDGTKNFCTSDDVWFRPVNFVNAPDGCLHVCDMYREVIEHPWSIPDDIHAGIDLLKGQDKGRIWRLAPKSSQHRATPKLGSAPTGELVSLLDHPNAWHRETAQRLLFERQDKSAVEPLRVMVKGGKTAQGRIAALSSLHRVNALRFETLMDARHDPAPEMRSRSTAMIAEAYRSLAEDFGSIRLDEHFERTQQGLERLDQVLNSLGRAGHDLHHDESPMVRFHAALEHTSHSAHSWHPPLSDFLDPWMLSALSLCGLGDQTEWIIDEISHMEDSVLLAGFAKSVVLASFSSGSVKSAPLEDFAGVLKDQWFSHPLTTTEAIITLNELFERQGSRLSAKLSAGSENGLADWLHRLTKDAIIEAFSDRFDTARRLRAMKLLKLSEIDELTAGMRQILNPSEPQELQFAALDTLGGYSEPIVADLLIEAWPNLTPALRDKATTLLLSRTDRIAKLLDAIDAKKIMPNQLSSAAKATLGRQKSPVLAERITKLIGDGLASNRKEVIAKYAGVMSMTGDATRGAKVYETACMVCHKHKDRGNDVGPHLGTIQGWTTEQILTNVLDPNREVSPNFALYIIETNDGRILSGLISSETAGNLTLKRADGGTDSVLRSEIKSLTSPGISLMPEGLESAITPQQMADLIEFLRST